MAKKRAKWGSKTRKCAGCGKSNGSRVRKCRHCGGDPRKKAAVTVTNGFADALVLEFRRVNEKLLNLQGETLMAEESLTRLQVMLSNDHDILVEKQT